MRIALPLADGKLCLHFGHCQAFALIDVDETGGGIQRHQTVPAPPHQSGLLPEWLAGYGVQVVIAGGMGSRAQGLFAQKNITVITGALPEEPERLVTAFLQGRLQTGPNVCDH